MARKKSRPKASKKKGNVTAFRRGKSLFSVKTCTKVKKSSVGRVINIPARCQK